VQGAQPAAKKRCQPSRASNCCGIKAESDSGGLTTATFPGTAVAQAKSIDFAFSGETLLYAPSVRENAFFEIHKDKEVRRTQWCNSKFFEFTGSLVQLPAGLKVYICTPKVAGTTRCVRLRLDGRSWWKRGDISALASSYQRALDKMSIVSSAPQFKSGRVSRKRRRNHRGKGSLSRRRTRRKAVVAKLQAISARDRAATQVAAAAYVEQQSVQLAKDTQVEAGQYLADYIAMNGPHFMHQPTEEQFPGKHDAAVLARANLVNYVTVNYTKPIQLPKLYLKSRHTFTSASSSRAVPTHLILDNDRQLSVVYDFGGYQQLVPIMCQDNVANYFKVVDKYNCPGSLVEYKPARSSQNLPQSPAVA